MKWACGTVWLLCALIVAAFLDRVPDPPAVNPDRVKSKALCVGSQFESSAYQQPDWRFNFRAAHFAASCPVCENVLEPSLSGCHLHLMRQATDSSPPRLVS